MLPLFHFYIIANLIKHPIGGFREPVGTEEQFLELLQSLQ